MKKFAKIILMLCLVAALAVTVAACNDDKGNEGGGGGGTQYSIQAPAASEVFTIEGLPETATEGTAVTFKVVLAHPEDSIIHKVELAYNTSIKYETLTAGADGSYSFTMPAEPVRLTVDADYYPDNEEDNFLKWSPANETSVEKWVPHFDGDEYLSSFDHAELVAYVSKAPAQSGNYFTSHEERAFSLDQDVIPDDALSVTYEDEDTSNSAVSFTVNIDRTKVSAGTAKVVLVVENGHKFGDESVLVCTVTVTEPEEYEKIDTWNVTVVFDISAIEDEPETEDMAFIITDVDYEEDMYLRESQMFDLEDLTVKDGKVSVTFTYAVGHKYKVEFHYYMSGQSTPPDIKLADGTFEADYSAGVMSFDKDGASIELVLYR